MRIVDIPFQTVDWLKVEPTEHAGEQGMALWMTKQHGDIRVRMVEYSRGYVADHWCSKGHFILLLEGELVTELQDGRVFTMEPGMSYHVADGQPPHRSRTESGAKLFIVD
jgi:hypothetical protein